LEAKNIMARGKNYVQTINKYSSYNSYLIVEWEKFKAEPKRREALLKATENMQVQSVLDIGCGAGQEMLPFVARGAKAVGMDVMPEVGQVGREMFAAEGFDDKVSFVRASGNELPFSDDYFDVLISRGAIMFMDVEVALREMARVLRPGGIFFLMFQAPPYYWWKVGDGIKGLNFLSSIHALRVLFAGNLYRLMGRQSFNKLTAGGETFITKKILERDTGFSRMKIIGEMPDTNKKTPSLIIIKKETRKNYEKENGKCSIG